MKSCTKGHSVRKIEKRYSKVNLRGNSGPNTGSLQSLMRCMRSHNPKYTSRHTYPKKRNTGKLKTPGQYYFHLSRGVEHLPSLINWTVTHISAAFDGPTPALYCTQRLACIRHSTCVCLKLPLWQSTCSILPHTNSSQSFNSVEGHSTHLGNLT